MATEQEIAGRGRETVDMHRPETADQPMTAGKKCGRLESPCSHTTYGFRLAVAAQPGLPSCARIRTPRFLSQLAFQTNTLARFWLGHRTCAVPRKSGRAAKDLITWWFGGSCLAWLARVGRGFDCAYRAAFVGMGCCCQRRGDILGPGRSAPDPSLGASFGAQWLPARRWFVRNRENRRPGLTGLEKELDRMRFTSVSHVHGHGPDRRACQVDRRTGRGASCLAPTALPEQRWRSTLGFVGFPRSADAAIRAKAGAISGSRRPRPAAEPTHEC